MDGRSVADRYLQAAGAFAASTPLQSSAFVTCPPSMTSWRFSAVIGVGWRMNELTVLPPGVLNGWAVRPALGATFVSINPSGSLRLSILPPLHRASAAAPAVFPSSLAFFQTSTYCLPWATLF